MIDNDYRKHYHGQNVCYAEHPAYMQRQRQEATLKLPEEQAHPYPFDKIDFERLCIVRDGIRHGIWNEG